MNKISIFVKAILIPVLVGTVVGLVISGNIDYNSLQQPAFAPPAVVFPIVWTVLYILMGVSYGILQSDGLVDKEVDSIYYYQLTVNALWSIFFFLLKWRLFSFFWIILLIFLVWKMAKEFYRRNQVAGLLQIPYLIWLIFAAFLNLSVYFLNK